MSYSHGKNRLRHATIVQGEDSYLIFFTGHNYLICLIFHSESGQIRLVAVAGTDRNQAVCQASRLNRGSRSAAILLRALAS